MFLQIHEIFDKSWVGQSLGGKGLSSRKALTWVLFWFDLALCADIGVMYFAGREKALEFLSGYIIEQSLSIDNLFLFILIFSGFGIKAEYQRRILNYGIAGACILRLIFITLGATAIHKFHSILYVFGIILMISGIKMFRKKEENTNIRDSKVIKVVSYAIPVSDKLEGDSFFIRHNRLLYATPLFIVLIVIEFSDIIFAIDSIPAIFSITTDPYIVYISNILAILGLRNMYFVLGKIHEKFRFVKYGVAVILFFTGAKLTALIFNIYIPTGWSLLIIMSILASSIAASMALTLKEAG